MAYASRFGCTAAHDRVKHDPAFHGIFIHGGSSTGKGRFAPSPNINRFSITTPSKGGKIDKEKLLPVQYRILPTFKRALDHAREVRASNIELKDCPIYACTDLVRVNGAAGKYCVQRVA
jgi:hypothetical protein